MFKGFDGCKLLLVTNDRLPIEYIIMHVHRLAFRRSQRTCGVTQALNVPSDSHRR